MIAIKEHAYFLLPANDSRTHNAIDIFIVLKHQNTVRSLGRWHQVIMLLVSYEGQYVGAEDHQFCFIEDYIPIASGSMDDAMNGMFLFVYRNMY